MSIEIREMGIEDYDAVMKLWQVSKGIGLSEADSRPSLASCLERNPGLSFVALFNGEVVAAVLCGHDGRRGYIHHLAVRPDFRRKALGRELVARGPNGLKQFGIQKCHLLVCESNTAALSFWRKINWSECHDLKVWSYNID